MPSDRLVYRRRLLHWLAASPLLPYADFSFAAPDIPSKLSELEAEPD